MHRRQFVKSLGTTSIGVMGISGLGMSGQLLAASNNSNDANRPRFLLVFLRGGYDAANLLVPVYSKFYYQARPGIAIARPSKDPNSALPLTNDWGLHPALRDTIFPMFKSGEVAFIPFAGTDDTTRSHFETQDSIEMGQASGPAKNFRSGFLNRLSAVLRGCDPMAFTAQLPLVFQGSVQVPNTALGTVSKPWVDARQSSIIANMYGNTPLANNVNKGFSVRDEVAREVALEMDTANRNAVTAKGFSLEAQRIARLMKERYSLGFVDIGGWDTHVNQGGARGYLANRFEELGQGLAVYAKEMGPMWRNTTVVVVSEFGRTFRQNGNWGTDHGHGSVYWVLGGSVRGGKVLGTQVEVTQASLFQDRDYPVLNDYRAVLAALLSRQYGLNAAQIEQVFSGVAPKNIGLL